MSIIHGKVCYEFYSFNTATVLPPCATDRRRDQSSSFELQPVRKRGKMPICPVSVAKFAIIFEHFDAAMRGASRRSASSFRPRVPDPESRTQAPGPQVANRQPNPTHNPPPKPQTPNPKPPAQSNAIAGSNFPRRTLKNARTLRTLASAVNNCATKTSYACMCAA